MENLMADNKKMQRSCVCNALRIWDEITTNRFNLINIQSENAELKLLLYSKVMYSKPIPKF